MSNDFISFVHKVILICLKHVDCSIYDTIAGNAIVLKGFLLFCAYYPKNIHFELRSICTGNGKKSKILAGNYGENMKVIQWLDKFYPPLGGGPASILTLMNGLKEIEFEVITNASFEYPNLQQYSSNVSIRCFLPYDVTQRSFYKELTKPLYFPYKVASEYVRFKNKKKFLINAEYDILHVNGPELNYGFITFDRLLHRPFLQKISRFDFVNKPKVLTLRGTPSLQTNNYADLCNERQIIEMFDTIICVEKYIYHKLREQDKLTDMGINVFYIPNSVDINIFDYNVPKYSEKLKLLFIGRLAPVRGLNLIYDLIQNLPNYVELIIIGSGTSNRIKEFRSRIEGKRNVTFYQNVRNNLVSKYIKDCDIILNPVKVEGISRVSLESLACGRPVIMLDKGNRYPVINGKTGYLIKEDINELLSLLDSINTNKEELQRFGQRGRKIIENEFSNEVVLQKIENIYKELI